MEKQLIKVGRRKEAVARVIVHRGTGQITVNEKPFTTYFPVLYLQHQVTLPLKTIDALNQFDVVVNVQGGGKKGQAEAVKLGIARALCEINPEFRPSLKKAGLLTRDPRVVERKKPGKKKARRSFQFSKR
ncbi:MAG: 30S ribosomal protein S9 [Thermoflavifilum sp.]|nr:30S ribosomal protein S9 [Thermoflavifilum sp.]